MLKGKELVKYSLNDAPSLPGVYRMLDLNRHIIYIGKAKNIKNRLSQYTGELTRKNEAMIALVNNIEYSVTDSESAALILEGQLIRKFKPKFNILLKDDKSFPYIKLRLDHQYPQILKYRGKDLKNGKYYGPFASVKDIEITLIELQKIFKLRSCSDSYFASRTRPCLQYQIKRCYAPCVQKISEQDYNELVEQVKAFLSAKNTDLQKMLLEKMHKLSDNMNFELAAEIRDRIKALSYIQLKSGGISSLITDADIIAIAKKNGEFCVQLFIYRASSPCGNVPYFLSNTEEENEAVVLESFLLQFYQNKQPAKEILLNCKIENISAFSDALKKLHGYKVKVLVPNHGEKKKLIDNALRNAELSLDKHLRTSAKNIMALQKVQEIFNLDKMPERIELYDNSHIQGSFAVGAMVVAGIDGFDKKEYRLYTIKEPQNNYFGGDDYAMLKEVLTRRFARLKLDPSRTPDLMIIDGGKGHMGVVKKIMDKSDLKIPFVCMSKGVERNAGLEQFHRLNKPEFTIDKNEAVMKYLQILRDEVHNFAIKSHRSKRSKVIRYSSLDEIPGIGEKRKKDLLGYFGSLRAVRESSVDEIAKTPGISKDLALVIYQALNSQ
jgi:excinuclease ABC subunit C